MNTHLLFVKSIGCSSCMITIRTALLKMKGVAAVDIFKEESKLCVSGESIERADIIEKLATLGYHDNGNTGLFSKQNTFEHWYCYSCASCDS
ncbi:MAG: heavy metal-associated domain-containing protein [Ferruginibacter sp.]